MAKKKMVEWLLAHGADVSLSNNDGETAYTLAQEKNHYDIAELLS